MFLIYRRPDLFIDFGVKFGLVLVELQVKRDGIVLELIDCELEGFFGDPELDNTDSYV